MSFIKWFETFLAEKKLPDRSWTLTDLSGTEHFIGTDVVIEAIKAAPEHEQRKIKDTIVRLDVLDRDILHYFQHLAQALVNRRNG